MSRSISLLMLAVLLASAAAFGGVPTPVDRLIGYTELRTNLPGGRHANVTTMRAMIVRSDGTDRREIAAEIVSEPNTWTQFAGWSPDGRTAIVGRGWESPENARWKEEHKTFRFTADGWLVDSFLIDIATGAATNVTAVERASFYNGGLFFWPNDPAKLGFTALIDGNSHPFRMDRDGRNKVDLTTRSPRRMADTWPTARSATASGNYTSCTLPIGRKRRSPKLRPAAQPSGRTGNRTPRGVGRSSRRRRQVRLYRA